MSVDILACRQPTTGLRVRPNAGIGILGTLTHSVIRYSPVADQTL